MLLKNVVSGDMESPPRNSPPLGYGGVVFSDAELLALSVA